VTNAPTLEPCYLVNVDGEYIQVCNGTDVTLFQRESRLTLNFSTQSCAWFRLNLAGSANSNDLVQASVYAISMFVLILLYIIVIFSLASFASFFFPFFSFFSFFLSLFVSLHAEV
jgi:hypothetical protein